MFHVVPSRTQPLCFLFSGKLAQNTYFTHPGTGWQCTNDGSTHLSVRSENWTDFVGQTPDGATPRTQTDRTQPTLTERTSLSHQKVLTEEAWPVSFTRPIKCRPAILEFFNHGTLAAARKLEASSPYNYTNVVTYDAKSHPTTYPILEATHKFDGNIESMLSFMKRFRFVYI
ncbi:hypothetical protein PGTUg99_017108 [Puccinia graminis f. sp. tritici]|uniref:Uncharacterized protein n=1 Tax=Puccinia graminis f. sp. tritici TaxID=56615 RepID=A0A5B0PDI9_PUCGR|nr:hypothetical protein PGTUg99_017108 [Puccinia graminis f. sp. tritici]